MLISSVTLTNFAYAQSTPKPRIVVNSIIQNTPVIVANSPNNEFLVGVSNTGNAPGTKKITLVMYQNYGSDNQSAHPCTTLSSGFAVFTIPIILNPGESEIISWKCEVYGAGPYQVKSLGQTLNFNVIDFPVNIVVDKITVNPSKPKFGDNAVFFVTMKNTDTVYGSKKISYQLRFSSMDSSTPPFKASFGTKDIRLGPGESTTFTVDTVFSSEMPWSFCVDDFCLHSFLLSESSEQIQPEQTPPSEQEKTEEEKQADEDRKRLKKDVEESKTEEEKQADEDRKRLKKDVEEYDKEQEQERESEQQEEEETDDTDEIEGEEEQVTGSKLVVTDVIVMPRKGLKQGDAVTITAVVRNSGDAKGTKEIIVQGDVRFHDSANGESKKHILQISSKTITVEPGKEKTLKWENIAVLGHGMYYLTVDEFNTEFWVGLKNPTPIGIKALDEGIKLDPDEVREAQKTYIRSAPDAEERSKMEAFWKYMSKKQPAEKVRSVDELKTFDIDDAADFDSDKKKFNIDDAADFDTNDGESESLEDGVLSSEDLDRIKNVSDMQVIDDLESIRDKILSVDFGSVVGPSDDQTKIKTISEKYDAANNKLRIAIEKREQVNDLKQELEKKREKFNELRDQVNSDIREVGKTHNISDNPSIDDKLREKDASDDLHKSLKEWVETTQDMDKLTEKIRELEPEADKQYDEAMKDLDSISDELDKANQGESNYEDKNQKPFVTDDLKKETYQDAARSIDDIMRVTEEYEKNRDALQKQDTLRQIIDEKTNQQLNNDVYDTYFGDKPLSSTFYPGDLESLSSVSPRVEHQNAVWSVLEDSGTLQKHKTKALQALEQKSESNIEQISTQTELVGKLQDASYFGAIPAQANTDNVATLSFGAMSQSGFDGVLSGDIPIKPIFDDGKTAKYSVLGGNLVIVDPSSRQIEDVLSIAFGKGRIDQSGKMTFVINAVDDIGQHKTITLGSNQGDSTVMISGGSEFALTSMTISNTIPLDDVSDKTVQDAMSRQVADEFEQYLVSNAPTDDAALAEWQKLKAEAMKAKEKAEQAKQKRIDAQKKYEESKDPKLKEKLDKIEEELDKTKEEKNKAGKEYLDAKKEAKESRPDDVKNKEKEINKKYEEAKHGTPERTQLWIESNKLDDDLSTASKSAKAKFDKAKERSDSIDKKIKQLESDRDNASREYDKSANEDARKSWYDAMDEEQKTRNDAFNADKRANSALEKIKEVR